MKGGEHQTLVYLRLHKQLFMPLELLLKIKCMQPMYWFVLVRAQPELIAQCTFVLVIQLATIFWHDPKSFFFAIVLLRLPGTTIVLYCWSIIFLFSFFLCALLFTHFGGAQEAYFSWPWCEHGHYRDFYVFPGIFFGAGKNNLHCCPQQFETKSIALSS